MHYMLQNLNKLSELHWWSMAFKFYFSLPPLVSLVNGHCSLWHLWSVTHTASHQELQWQQKDSASGSLRAFLLALVRKQQTYPPYAPQPKNKLHAISLLPLDSYYSWNFFSLISLPPSEKSYPKIIPGVYLNTRKSFLSPDPHASERHWQHLTDHLRHYPVFSSFWFQFLHKLKAKMLKRNQNLFL